MNGELQAVINVAHNTLCRGAGVYGNYFYTYGDDKKLIFYKEKEEEEEDEGKLSDVEKAQQDMVIEEEDVTLSRGNKLKLSGLSSSGSFNPFDILQNN